MQVIQSVDKIQQGKINFIDCYRSVPVEFGVRDKRAGDAARVCLQRSMDDLKKQKIDGLVTAPICKETIHSEQFPWDGHTEWLQALSDGDALMLMVSERLKVGFLTNHLPIEQVAAEISEDKIYDKLKILNRTLIADFGIIRPRIAVLGLNPHAGDGGLLGKEETELFMPAIKRANADGMLVFGTYPADGFFGSGKYASFDAVLAAYHDQGLIPFKLLDMSGVNMTAGLSVVRTSPDHGTGFDIAGKGEADETSMRHAIWLAVDVIRTRKQPK